MEVESQNGKPANKKTKIELRNHLRDAEGTSQYLLWVLGEVGQPSRHINVRKHQAERELRGACLIRFKPGGGYQIVRNLERLKIGEMLTLNVIEPISKGISRAHCVCL